MNFSIQMRVLLNIEMGWILFNSLILMLQNTCDYRLKNDKYLYSQEITKRGIVINKNLYSGYYFQNYV